MDKDNRDVCGLSAVDPCPNCGLASALSSRMLPHCPGWAWFNRSCLARTVAGWLVPMVWSRVRARARAEQVPLISSCSNSSRAAAAEEQQQQQFSNSSIISYLKRDSCSSNKQQQIKRATYCICTYTKKTIKNSCP